MCIHYVLDTTQLKKMLVIYAMTVLILLNLFSFVFGILFLLLYFCNLRLGFY